ncbi:hypothetical protein AGMMS49546_26850 [Spirochaetia bacterium]|nr:hypothetical protein AGMMS49546_26850 [Spirochaetia bacterium]
MKIRSIGAAVLLLLCPLLSVSAQDGFGFGFDDDTEEETAAPALPVSVKISGEVSSGLTLFPNDFTSEDKARAANLGDLFEGKLNFNASSRYADGLVNFNISPDSIRDLGLDRSLNPFHTPKLINEAYLRAYFGPVNIEGGFRKLSWGKADSLGPLDVTNPLDYSDLTNITDLLGRKIARPMVHAAWSAGDFSKLEAVFIPAFQGHRYELDSSGRWYPTAITGDRTAAMLNLVGAAALARSPQLGMGIAQIISSDPSLLPTLDGSLPSTAGLEYAQAGLRFTTTIAQADFGVQYYYGNLFRPSFSAAGVDAFLDTAAANLSNPNRDALAAAAKGLLHTEYNRYHQIGIDYAQVLFGFNTRSEFAANITKDLTGDDGAVYNPSLAWSLGFDRDVYRGINVNLQANESIRLMHDKVNSNPALDTEADSAATNTALTLRISKKLLQEKLELKLTNIWNIETMDLYCIPAVAYTLGDLTAELSGGVFGGKDGGELSQYQTNGFIKTVLTYSF